MVSAPLTRTLPSSAQFPHRLRGELSCCGGLTDGAGRLSGDWRDLFARHSDRFLLGSDTWINERRLGYHAIMISHRAWVAQLPPEQARRIASGHARRLFPTEAGRLSLQNRAVALPDALAPGANQSNRGHAFGSIAGVPGVDQVLWRSAIIATSRRIGLVSIAGG